MAVTIASARLGVGREASLPQGPYARAWRQLRRHRLGLASSLLLSVLALFVGVGPALVPFAVDDIDMATRFGSPTAKHLFGTDDLGRDTLVRVMQGGRVSLLIGFSVAISSVVLGAIIGTLAGYAGGVVDSVTMRVLDVLFSIPRIALLLVLAKLVGPGLVSVAVILIATEWTTSARLARGVILSLREQPYVEAARCAGASVPRLMLAHLLPNALAPLIVEATLGAGAAIRAETTLSYLGLGVQPPAASWGNLLANSQLYFFTAPWLVVIPGLFIFLALMSFNLAGDALRDALDPRSRQS